MVQYNKKKKEALVMVKTDVNLPLKYNSDDVMNAVVDRLPIRREDIKELRLLRSSLDLSDKASPSYKISVGISLDDQIEARLLRIRKRASPVPELSLHVEVVELDTRPVVVGAGPCGIFAALILAEAGTKPLVIERGLSVRERSLRVKRFVSEAELDEECNVQFGEGGAGTYSDGKLKVGSLDKYKMKVLDEFVSAGAEESITHSATAHLGTDKLPQIVECLRKRIESLGGEFSFSSKFVDFTLTDGKISSVKYIKDGRECIEKTSALILASGHSARDTFSVLKEHGVSMMAKGFGIGVRIEHPREYINELVYGKSYDSSLEAASYHLVTHLDNGRSIYSFCMCPGGTVVAAASERSALVTNGMSVFARDGENSNAAFLVSVSPSDFASDSPLAGFDLQRRIERAAFVAGGSDFQAPAIRMEDFLYRKAPTVPASVLPSYPIGTRPASPERYLPESLTASLRSAITDFDDWMKGFYYPDAILTGAETRSTSPVRVLRDECYESVSVKGLYPSGEGAGYAGGIVSSAVDGVRTALALIEKHKKK